jgi:DNA repair exonuclease SbcCD nuclease subunit
MKILVVGDPHVRSQDLDECQRLMEFVKQVALEQKPDFLLVTGDLYHTHDIVHCEVMDFWRKTLESWADLGCQIVLVKGNHDAPHDAAADVNALVAHRGQKNVLVVDQRCSIGINAAQVAVIPFMASKEEFVANCKAVSGMETVYCHQTFNGGQYDNGMYAKEGLDPDLIPQKQVISGHIHTGQEFGKIWYVGSPRWLTVSDANKDRFIWVVEHDSTGAVIARQPYATDHVCTRIVEIDETPDQLFSAALNPKWKYVVNIRGPAAFVEERKQVWRGKARVRPFPDKAKKVIVRESEGIPKAFQKFQAAYQPLNRTPPEVLEALVRERLGSGLFV